MKILIDIILLFGLVAGLIIFAGSLFMMLFKRTRKRGFRYFLISIVGIVIASAGILYTQEQEALKAGFADAQDMRTAKEFGYTDAGNWNKDRKQVLAEHKARLDTESLRTAPNNNQTSLTDTLQATDNEHEAPSPETDKQAEAKHSNGENTPTKPSKHFIKNSEMTELTITALKTHMSLEAKPRLANKPLCREDGFCEFVVEPFQFQIYGNGIAKILTSTQASHSQYRHLCAVMFSGLSGAEINFSKEAIEAAFLYASQNGKFRQDINTVQIEISPDLNNILECELFRY